MKTSQFIDSLAADPALRGMNLRTRFLLALGLGALLSAGLFVAVIGPRPDVVAAAGSLRFDLKFVDTLALVLPSALLCWRLLRPEARPGAMALLLLAPFVLLAGAVVVELLLVPRAMWGSTLVGSNALNCLTFIPLLSIAPLFALLYAMRAGAPRNPALTGALAGAASAGIAATLYAARISQAHTLLIAGCNHMPMLERTTTTANALTGFLQ